MYTHYNSNFCTYVSNDEISPRMTWALNDHCGILALTKIVYLTGALKNKKNEGFSDPMDPIF